MKKTIWIAFDFGMKGDYEGLYRWLDEKNAEERGYGLALIKQIDFPKKYMSDEKSDQIFVNLMKAEIKKYTEIGGTDRIYMIWKSLQDKNLRGAFLFGNKKNAPWTGYSQKDSDMIDFDIDDQ